MTTRWEGLPRTLSPEKRTRDLVLRSELGPLEGALEGDGKMLAIVG
jgi:hypothetical protein